MTALKRCLPAALTTLRLALGPVALAVAVCGLNRWIFLPLLIAGTLSDIFDGILARRYGVATPALRRYDSLTDIIYYLFVLGATVRLCRPVVNQTWWLIALILFSEAMVIAVCQVKFHRFPATHSILAKIYGLCLLAGLAGLLVFNAGPWIVAALAAVALAANSEIIALHLVSREAPVDVKSIFWRKQENNRKT